MSKGYLNVGLKANGNRFDMTHHFDLRGETICVGDLVMVTQENHKGKIEYGLYIVGKSKYGHYILISTQRKDVKLDLDAFMYWRGSIFKQDIEIVAKGVENENNTSLQS